MARKTRSTELESRTARSKLKAGKYHWRGIRQGLAVGYRKVKGDKGGTWTVRLLIDHNRYTNSRLGAADDHQDGNGINVLSYDQAQEKARAYAHSYVLRKGDGEEHAGQYTVRDAINDYLRWYGSHRKALKATKYTCDSHILPVFSDRVVADLTTQEIRKWHQSIANKKPRLRTTGPVEQKYKAVSMDNPDVRRKRKASANRILTVLKAALNHAWKDGKVPSDDAWRRVKPFRDVSAPTIRYLTEAECTQLLNACPADFQKLVRAALLTGCRYGELTTMLVHDFHSDAGTILAREPKNGKPRYVPLNSEGQDFFGRITVGRKNTEHLFVREDGSPWGASHQQRRLTDACGQAAIKPKISFHILRHTYATLLLRKGVSIRFVAEALGNSVPICEKHYAHVIPSDLSEAIQDHLPSFGVVESGNVSALRRSINGRK